VTDCLFCRIALGEIPAQIVYQDADVVAFRDVQPQAPVHVLVIPRLHIGGFADTGDEHRELLGTVAQTAARVAQLEGIAETGFRCVVNSGSDAQQSVRHLHMHVLGGRQMNWPPG
jgi:histidine triad (HIT) family protein